jgi:hypothetical protein
MGDRGNIKIPMPACNGEPAGNVFLYGHWSGEDLPKIVQAGLKAGVDRWEDNTYLARIIFCQMMGNDTQSVTGYGIGSYPADNEYPYLVVDVDAQEVRVELPQGGGTAEIIRRHHSNDTVSGKATWTFLEYVYIDNPQWVQPDRGE